MKLKMTILTVVAIVAACGGKRDVDLGGDAGPTAVPALSGVDPLIVADNSSSVGAEQQILADALGTPLTGLTDPDPDKQYGAVDDLRVAVVSSDTGLSHAGIPADLSPPYDELIAGCGEIGDNGKFQCERGRLHR